MKVNIISEAYTKLGILIITTSDCVYCADTQGHVRWMQDMATDGDYKINDDMVTFIANGRQKAFNILTGQEAC